MKKKDIAKLRLDVKMLGITKGITQRQIAERLEIDETVLSRMLSADRSAALRKRYAEVRSLVDELGKE